MSEINSNNFSIKVDRATVSSELGENGRIRSIIKVFKGKTQLVPVQNNPSTNQFSVTIASSEGCTAIIKELDTVYVTSLTKNTGIITLNINVENSATFVKNINLIKSISNEEISIMESRVKIAEQKITEDAITNVVKRQFYTKGQTKEELEILSSTMEQTVDNWSVKITQNEKDISSLKLTSQEFDVTIKNKADSSNIISKINASTEGIVISSSKIDISGCVTFSDLSTSGKTTINGGNITTGTIDASKVTVKNISASNITTGTLDASKASIKNISASSITSGTLDGSKASITNINASNITTGTLNASNINVTNINGTNISRGVIDAGKVTVSNLNASNITSGTLSGDRIKGGTISASQEINFVGGARIFGTGGSYGAALTVSASEYYFSGASYGSMKGSWNISGSLSIGGGISASNLELSSWISCSSINCGSLSVDGTAYIGSAYINGSWVTSDKRLKTDIKYVNKDTQSINPIGLVSPNVNITTLDMHEFVETLPMVSYRLIDELNRNMDNTHYGFLAQEILYTKVGSELIAVEKDEYGNEIEGGYLRYSQDKYISFICGALQEEIKQRKQLEQKVLELEQKLGDDK